MVCIQRSAKILNSLFALILFVSVASATGLSVDMSLSGGPTVINSERWYQNYDNSSLLRFGTATSPYTSNAHSTTAVTLGRSGATRMVDGIEAYSADFAIGSTGVVQAFDAVGMEYDSPANPPTTCDQQGLGISNATNQTPGVYAESQDYESLTGMVGSGPEESIYRSAVSIVGTDVSVAAKRETEHGYIYTDVKAAALWGHNQSETVLNAGYEAREHIVSATNETANISETINIDWDVTPK